MPENATAMSVARQNDLLKAIAFQLDIETVVFGKPLIEEGKVGIDQFERAVAIPNPSAQPLTLD